MFQTPGGSRTRNSWSPVGRPSNRATEADQIRKTFTTDRSKAMVLGVFVFVWLLSCFGLFIVLLLAPVWHYDYLIRKESAGCLAFLCLAACTVSILFKSIAGRYRPVRVADGPITARFRFINNASWVGGLSWCFCLSYWCHRWSIFCECVSSWTASILLFMRGLWK